MSEVHSNLTRGPRRVTSVPGRAEMHPALYPILLLLARLRSRGAEATVMQMGVCRVKPRRISEQHIARGVTLALRALVAKRSIAQCRNTGH